MGWLVFGPAKNKKTESIFQIRGASLYSLLLSSILFLKIKKQNGGGNLFAYFARQDM